MIRVEVCLETKPLLLLTYLCLKHYRVEIIGGGRGYIVYIFPRPPKNIPLLSTLFFPPPSFNTSATTVPAARLAAGQLPFTNNTIEKILSICSPPSFFFVPSSGSLQTHVLFNDHFNRVDKISNIQGEKVSRPLDNLISTSTKKEISTLKTYAFIIRYRINEFIFLRCEFNS